MPPLVAALLYLMLIVIAWQYDSRNGYKINGGLWIVFIWMIFLGSRHPSYWLTLSSPGGETDNLDGNTFDRNFYILLSGTAIILSIRRNISWSSLFRGNWPIFLIYGYFLLSCVWSDNPFASLKRWVKDIIAIAVIFPLFCDPVIRAPRSAIQGVFTKCALVLFPLSMLFINYFPELGRVYSRGGGLQITGVANQKNTLGEMICVVGLLLFWRIMNPGARSNGKAFINRNFLPLGLLALGLWLLCLSDSKTALICLLVGSAIIASQHAPILRNRPKLPIILCIAGMLLFYLLDNLAGLSGLLLKAAGRDATFTGRTAIWDAIQLQPEKRLLGNGYLIYWDVNPELLIGGNLVSLRTAHNGYLDVYLDGGIIGLALLIGFLVVTGIRTASWFIQRDPVRSLGFVFFIITIIANFSESSFFRKCPLWFGFLLFTVDYSKVFVSQANQLRVKHVRRTRVSA